MSEIELGAIALLGPMLFGRVMANDFNLRPSRSRTKRGEEPFAVRPFRRSITRTG